MQNESFYEVIDAIFAKLAVRYGAVWMRQWDGLDMNLVKSDWGSELSGFASNLEPLRYALRNLPERCPNVGQFRAIANCCPAPAVALLEAPAANPVKVAQAMAQLGGVAKAMTAQQQDPRAWAKRILERVAAGERVGRYARESAQMAMGLRAKVSAI